MIHTTRKLFAPLVVSLFVVVISLPGIISAAYAPPVIASQKPVTEGMVAPVRIAMDKYGNYYMTDPLSKGVLKYNLYGKLVKTINVSGVPLGIAVASNDNIIVTQGKYASILSPNGVETAKLGIGVGQFIKANGVTIDKYDKIYVTDGLGNEVQVFNLSGVLVGRFGSLGDAPGNNGLFHNPSAIAYEKAADQIAVADTLNGRIQFFKATDYSYVKTIGTLADTLIGFISPEGIAFDYTRDVIPLLKRMYVVDTWRSSIQVIDPATPTFLSYIGSYGTAIGQLQTPSDLVLDSINSTGRLLVVNGAGNLQIYGVDGGLSPSKTIPPLLTINTVPNNTSSSSLDISGTVEVNAVVKVAITTAAVPGAVTGFPSTTWGCPITGLLPGSNIITVTATDAALNTSSQSVTVVYTPAAPSLTITTATNSFTNSITGFTINGTVDVGSIVAITNTTTGLSGNATVTGSTWSYLATQLQEGPNNLKVTATILSSAANTKSVVVIRDTVSPDLTVSAIASGSYSATSTQNIAGRVVDLHPGTVTMQVNTDPPLTVTTSDFSFSATLQPGANTVIVQATDLAGNASFTNTRTIYYDPAKPLISISAPVDNSYTMSSTATISGTVSNPATATVTVSGVPVTVTGGAWGPTPVTLVDGLNTISVVATSGANSSQEKRSVILDSIAPALAITSPALDITAGINIANMLITGTVTDAGSSVTVTAKVNNVAVSPAPTVTLGTFQFNANFVEGPNAVVVTATNAALNVTTVTRNILKDSIPPTPFTIIADPSGNPKAISGVRESGATVAVADGGYTFPVTYPTSTTWAADLSGGSYNPTTIQCTATDAAGNKSVLTGLLYTPPTGDINASGTVDITDALLALQCVVGTKTPNAAEILRGDIGPLLKGKANPNGRIDITDAILIQRKALDPAGTYW